MFKIYLGLPSSIIYTSSSSVLTKSIFNQQSLKLFKSEFKHLQLYYITNNKSNLKKRRKLLSAMPAKTKIAICLFRNDLRVHDNEVSMYVFKLGKIIIYYSLYQRWSSGYDQYGMCLSHFLSGLVQWSVTSDKTPLKNRDFDKHHISRCHIEA